MFNLALFPGEEILFIHMNPFYIVMIRFIGRLSLCSWKWYCYL